MFSYEYYKAELDERAMAVVLTWPKDKLEALNAHPVISKKVEYFYEDNIFQTLSSDETIFEELASFKSDFFAYNYSETWFDYVMKFLDDMSIRYKKLAAEKKMRELNRDFK